MRVWVEGEMRVFHLTRSFFVTLHVLNLSFWTGFKPPDQKCHMHTPFCCSIIRCPPKIQFCSFMWQLLFCLCIHVCGACVMGQVNLGSACKVPLETSEEEEDERVKCASGDKTSLTSPSWISCFLFIVLSHEDNKTLTFDFGGTEAHPATDAILFRHLVTPHHMTGVTCHLLDCMYVIADHSAML